MEDNWWSIARSIVIGQSWVKWFFTGIDICKLPKLSQLILYCHILFQQNESNGIKIPSWCRDRPMLPDSNSTHSKGVSSHFVPCHSGSLVVELGLLHVSWMINVSQVMMRLTTTKICCPVCIILLPLSNPAEHYLIRGSKNQLAHKLKRHPVPPHASYYNLLITCFAISVIIEKWTLIVSRDI